MTFCRWIVRTFLELQEVRRLRSLCMSSCGPVMRSPFFFVSMLASVPVPPLPFSHSLFHSLRFCFSNKVASECFEAVMSISSRTHPRSFFKLYSTVSSRYNNSVSKSCEKNPNNSSHIFGVPSAGTYGP